MKKFTYQEAFNIIWEHAKKKEKGFGPSKCYPGEKFCRLRGDNGSKCFIGVLIPDEEYEECMESDVVSFALSKRIFESDSPGRLSQFSDTIRSIHDLHETDKWEKLLRQLAHDFGLTVPA